MLPLLIVLLACSTNTPTTEAPKTEAPKTEAPKTEAPAGNVALGGPVEAAGALPADQVIAEADKLSGREITVTGTVREVCQKKGCWHTLSTSDPNTNIMVKDKEYAIFLPKDCAGKSVAIQGTFTVEAISEEEARHYAQDAGRDPSVINGPQRTYLMDASGVKFL